MAATAKLIPTMTKKASRIFDLMLAPKNCLVLIREIVTNSPFGEDEFRL